MKDYLYYLFDEKMNSAELSSVKEEICASGAKVIDLSPTKKEIYKRLKELKGPKKYALLIGNTVESQQAAQKARVHFCGWLDGSTDATDFQSLPYRQLLKDIKLLPLLSHPYPYHNYGWLGNTVKKYIRWIHFKQIKGMSHKPKHSEQLHVCRNCGETYEGNFCPTCGQTHKTPRFDIKDLFKNILSEAINIEHGFLRNFLELFWRPGYMVSDYLSGKRKDYHKPFQTIFVLATIYLVAAHLLDPASFVKKEEVKLEDLATTSKQLSESYVETNLQPWLDEIRNLTDTVIAIKREGDALMAEQMTDSIIRAQGRIWKMSKQDSLFIVNRVRRGIAKTDDQKLSEVMANEEELPGFIGWVARLSIRNMEVVEKFEERYYHEGTFLYAMVEMIKDFFDMNKAVAIILMIPVMVFCARRSFRTTLVSMRTNLAEYILLFTFIGSQLLWLQLITLLFTQTSNFAHSFDTGAGIMFLIWDLKQFFNLTWGDAFKRSVLYMGGYSILLAILLVPTISVLGSIVMWFLYQIT